jgi:hypothetical protein
VNDLKKNYQIIISDKKVRIFKNMGLIYVEVKKIAIPWMYHPFYNLRKASV